MAEPIISTAEPIFTYENIKNNKEIRDQWRNYILQKFSDKARWPLLTQILGDSSTLQIDKLTPESFNKINKMFGAPAIYEDRPIDATPLRPPLMQKSVQQTPATQNDKTDKPVVVTGGQPSNGNPSKKTIGWSSDNGYMYDPSSRLNNDVQYVMNTLKTYGYPQQVLDSFKQDIDKILANTKDNNRIDTANQYIDQFLRDKQDLRRLDPAPGKPAPTDVTAAVMKAVKADGNTSFANWRQSLVNQGWDGDPSKIKYDPSTGKFMYNGGGQAVKSAGKPAPNQQPQKAGNKNKSGKKPRMSDAEIDAFLNEELGGDTTGNGTYASPGVAKGGTYASPGISSGGTYATGEGIKDANGNILTNPGGNADYQYALRDPSYGIYVRDRLTDAQKNYLQAVAHDMGYNYDR